MLIKYSLFAKLEKCQFYKNKVYILSYIIITQKVKIKNKKIEIIKN